MVKTKIVEWQHFFFNSGQIFITIEASRLQDNNYLNRPLSRRSGSSHQMMEGMRKISLGVVENNHSCCSAFLSGFSRCWAWDFQPNKSRDFCPIRWADLGLRLGFSQQQLGGEERDYHWYLSAQRAPDLPCSTASSMESMTVAYLSWKSMLKRKELLLANSTIDLGL